MGRTLKEEHEKLLRLLDDSKPYAAVQIKTLGLKTRTWDTRTDPEISAKTFQANLSRKTRYMGKPDDTVFISNSWLPAWTGAKWKEVFGVEDAPV